MSARWAPDNAEGLHPYVVTRSEWGRQYERIEYARNLAEAKRDYGWTRAAYASMSVRRATPADVERVA